MNDEKTMKVLRTAVMFAFAILMSIRVVLQLWAFEVLRDTILCSCVLLLIIVELVCDGICKDRKEIITHGVWYVLLFFNVISNLFKF